MKGSRIRVASTTAPASILLLALAVLVTGPFLSAVPATAADNDEVWNDLRTEIFGDRSVKESAGAYTMYAEKVVHDAALVPISVRVPADLVDKTQRMHLIVDRNPAPIAAVFNFGPGFRDARDVGERRIETRIRVDHFSNVRAVFETTDGELFMAERFVGGAGGCTSVSPKDPDLLLAQLGRIKAKVSAHPARGEAWREGVVMVRHPNFTGMQMNHKTGDFTPAWFVERLSVQRGGELVFTVEAGISLSEDPNIRFTYATGTGGDNLEITAVDSKGGRFSGRSSGSGS